MAEENVNLTEPMSQDIMSGTPESIEGTTDWNNIKDGLLTGSEPPGLNEIEGMENAAALNSMVSQFPVFNAPSVAQVPTLENARDEILGGGVEQVLKGIGKNGPNETQPVRFGIKSSNFDRYYNHPKFNELGFHPYANNELKYNERSSWWDENRRARSQWSKIFSTGFLSTYDAMGDMLRGEYLSADTDGAQNFADAMRIGNSTQEGTGAFFNNLVLNSGYTVGIIANIAVEELAMAGLSAASFGTATPAAATRTAYNAVRGAKAIDKLFDVGSYADKSRSMLNQMNNLSWTKDFFTKGGRWATNVLTPNTYKALKNINSVQNGASLLSNSAKIAKGVGGLYRDFRAINLAMAESKLEGGMVKNDLIDELYSEFVQENGRAPIGDELLKIVNKGDEAAFTTTMLNAPVIFFSNAIVFDTMLRGFRGTGSLLAAAQKGIGSRVLKSSQKQMGTAGTKAFYDGGMSGYRRFINRGLTGNLKTFAGASLNYGQANFVEGMQEVIQEGIAVGAKDYYHNLYKDPLAAGIDAIAASTYAGAKSQMSGQGFEVFMSGFLMGGLVQGPQNLIFGKGSEYYQKKTDPEGYKQYQEAKDAYIKETVDVLNKVYENPEEYFHPDKIQALTQKEINESLFSTTFAEDAMSFMDKKDSSKFHALYTIMHAGKMGEFKSQMQDYLQLDDRGLAQAFPQATGEEIKSGKTRERVQSMIDKMDDIEKSYNELNDKIINPFNPKQFKRGTNEHFEETISMQAFDHAKMIAMFTRDSFERALERSNEIYTELSSNPLLSKMDANDIAVLADTAQLIQEIRILKIDIKNQTTPIPGEGPVSVTGEMKTILDKKKKRLELLQDYFATLTDPENIHKYEQPKGKQSKDGSKEDVEFNRLTNIITSDAIKKTRENVLSTKLITDQVSEDLVKYQTGTSNPFGIFDINNTDKLEGPIMAFLNDISGDTKDNYIKYDEIKGTITKLIDHKALKGRAEDYNKIIQTILQPENLKNVSAKISVVFKELFLENKAQVKERMKAHVAQEEKINFLNALAEYGIYPEANQTETFLKGGAAPYEYQTENGILTPDTNLDLYNTKDDILGEYLNLSNNKVQSDKKDKVEKEEDVKDQESDPYNFEETHFEKEEESDEITESSLGKYTGNRYGDAYLVKKHKEYLVEREGKDGTVLTKHADWLADPVSKQARVVELAIKRIYDEIFIEEKLVGKSGESFYGWLNTMKSDQRVGDILRSVNIKMSDIIEEAEEDTGVKITTKTKVKETVITDKDTGDRFKTYDVVDENGNKINEKPFTNKKEAESEKRSIQKKRVSKKADSTPFPFAGKTYTKGDKLIDPNGEEYVVFSTPAMVETNKNIYLKHIDKIASRKKIDKLFRDETSFNEMNLEPAPKEQLDYRNTKSKIKVNEPLSIFPVYDESIALTADKKEEGISKLQKTLRELKPEDLSKITFRVTTGPNWFRAESEKAGDKENFKPFADAIENDLIKRHGQKWQVEVQLDEKTIGFFQGPTTLQLMNRKGNVINPMEITESQVKDIFRLNKQKVSDVVQTVKDNYTESYSVYDTIDKAMVGLDEKIFTQKELGVSLNVSEGSIAIAEPGEGVNFTDLDYNSLSFVKKEDLVDPNEKPYFILDYNRKYNEDGTLPTGKVEYNVITNIISGTPSRQRLKEEARKYENKFNPKKRVGKYIAFVTLPNGKSAYVNLVPKSMTESNVIDLFNDLQNRSIETTENNVTDKVDKAAYNKKYNAKLQNDLFISSNEGVYIEIKISQDGQFRMDYTDLVVKKKKKKGKEDIQIAQLIIPANKFQEMSDIQEVLDMINTKVFGSTTPLAGKALVTLESFKNSVPKDPSIEDIQNMSTKLNKEVKKDINFTMSSTDSIHVTRRKVAKSKPKELQKTADELSPAEKIDAYENDFSDVPIDILKGIALKLNEGKELTELEEAINSFRRVDIQGLSLQLATKPVSQSNTVSEANNQNAISEIIELKEKLKLRKRAIRNDNRSNNKDASPRELNEINKDAILNDPEIKLLDAQLRVVQSRANKIIESFDGHDIEDVETFTRWVQDNLPEDIRVNVEDLTTKLKSGYITVGQFYMQLKDISKGIMGLEGVITVSANSPFKYHEAFHSVFRMLLTEAEITKYLAIAKKEVKAKLKKEGITLDTALDNMRKQHVMYAEMTKDKLEERYYEEYLADEFDKFKMDPRSTKTNTENKSLFQRIIDFIFGVLSEYKPRQLNKLFDGIDSGKYKNTSIQENRFTKSFDGDIAYKLELIDPNFIERTAEDGSKKLKQVKNYIPADQVNEIVSGISNLYVSRLDKQSGPVDGKLVLDDAIADWIEMYNPDRDFYVDQGVWHDENVDELTLVYESLLEQIEDVRDLVTRRVSEYSGIQIEDVDYTEQDEKSVGDFDKSADMFGGYSSLPKRIRFLISQTTIEEADRYGNKYVNEETKEPIVINVNPEYIYNGLLKVLANTPNDLKMFQKAWLFSRNNAHTKAVVTKLFKDIGILQGFENGDMLKPEAEIPSLVADSSLYLSFIKGFRKYRVDNIFAHTDTDTGITHLYAANKKDDAHSTVQQWAEDFNRRYSKLKLEGSEEKELVKDVLTDLTNLLKRTSIPETYNLLERVESMTETLRSVAGMNIHENYILYSVYDGLTTLTEDQQVLYDTYSFVDPIEVEALSHIRQSLESGENLYLDNQTVLETEDVDGEIEYSKGGVKGRLKKLALNNSHFDESVGASTFIDSEGNRRYAHQDPTFHLEKIAEMDGADFINNKLQEDVFFEKNMLLKNPKFQAMVAAGQVRALRIVGSKEGALKLNDTGLASERGRLVGDTGVSFGRSKPREFALDMIHAYLYNYNRVSPDKTKVGTDINDNDFAIAPINIRVIEASNTGDFVAAPVHKMMNRKKSGNEISDKALDMFINEIRIEFDRARKFHLDEKNEIENLVDNKERLGKLHTTYTLLSKLEVRKRNVKAALPKVGKDQKAAISDGKQLSYLATAADTIASNLSKDEEGIVDIDGEKFLMKNRGKFNFNELSDVEQTELINRYNPSITTIEYEDKNQYAVDIEIGDTGKLKYYTYNPATRSFFKGYKDMVIFDFVKVKEEEVETKLVESEESGEIIADSVKLDLNAVQRIEQVAEFGIEDVKEEDLFNTVMEEIGGSEIIKERLQSEINEFILGLKELKAYTRISGEISKSLGQYKKVKKGTDTAYDNSNLDYYMELYNLKDNDLEFNLAQIYLNNYINTKSFNQLLLGDQALSLKNFIDAVKRAKMQNGAGASAATEIYDEDKGVMHKVDHMTAVVHEDFKYDLQFNEIYKTDRDKKKEDGDLQDGQIYVTEKTLRYMLFGFGKLNKAQSEVMDLIREGNITKINDEFFGSARKLSHKKLDMIANSLKIVYGDGLTFLKMSATLLSKNAYSVQDAEGNWIAREGREELHNLRVKLEKHEEDEWAAGRGTLGISVPKSASKMMNTNLVPENTDMVNESPIDPKYTMDLSAEYMRLQMINPSNKIEIVDARQIKNLITSEQDLGTKVIMNGVETTVGALVKRYHQLAGDKLKNEYFAQRNLTFNWSSAISALDKVSDVNGYVPAKSKIDADLRAFVKYAVAGLEASKAKTQMLSYFKVDKFGNPQYNLNGPMTHNKFEELFLAYFSKGILAGKQPGVSAALVSDFGMYSVKQVIKVDEKGTPIQWRVIRSDDWENLKRQNPIKYKAIKQKENLDDHKLETGDFYLDRLRSNVVEYDEFGNDTGQKYTEFMMPPHFRSQLQNPVAWNKTLPDAVAKMFGIRIPSQDKHSAVNLKLVDYLPVFMGSSAMYARELIELSGADFDIDKLYMQMKEFYYNGSEFVEYGKAKNEASGYKEYVRWVLENATKNSAIRQALNRWNDSETVKLTTGITADEYNALTSAEQAEERKKITSANNKITIDLLDAVMHSNVPLDAVMINKMFDRSEGLPESLESIGLPVTFAEYKAFKETNDREPYTAAINNEILDVKFGLLGNKGITEPREGRHTSIYYEPAVTTPLSDSNAAKEGAEGGVLEWMLNEIGDVLNVTGENQLDVDSLLGQIEAWTNNKEGARSIGNVVLPNMIMSLLTEYGIKIRNVKGVTIPEMNGVKYNSFANHYEINHETKKSDPAKARKQFIISALITAMTDNAKLRLASKLGLKKAALANVVTMLGMGVDLKTSILLMQFPTIKEALFHAENKDDMYDPGHISLLQTRLILIDETLIGEEKRLKTKFKPVAVNMDNIIEGISTIKFDRAETYKTFGLGDGKNGPDMPVDSLLLEKSVIEQYLNFNRITETAENISALINLQNGLGKDLVQFDKVQESAEKLGLTVSKKDFKDSIIPFDVRDIFLKKGSMHNVYYEVYRELHDKLLPVVMLKRTPKFIALKDKTLANMRRPDDKLKKKVSSDLVSYLTIKAYMVALTKDKYAGNSKESLSNSLIYDGNIYTKTIDPASLSIEKVINRIKDKLNSESKTNYFVDIFTKLMPAMHEDNKSGLIKLMSNTWTEFSDSELIRVQNSILELLGMDKGDGTMYDDVQHIVHYLAVMDGMAFGSGSFINVIPTELTKDLLNSTDSVQALFMQEKERKGAYKNVFNIDYSQMTDEFIKGYLTSKANFYYTNPVYKNVDIMEEPNPIDKALGIDNTEELDKKNKEIFAGSPLFIDEANKTMTIDIFRGLPFEFNQRVKRVRFLKKENYGKRDEFIEKLKKSGLKVKYVQIKIGDNLTMIPQIVFPAVLRHKKKLYMLDSVLRDTEYRTEEDLNVMIPSDSNVAFGNEAKYVEVEVKGSSVQNAIGFMFGPRPSAQDIIDFGNDKRKSFGEEIELNEKDEQSGKDVISNLFGDNIEDGNAQKEEFDEEDEGKFVNTEDPTELSDVEKLTDWYNSLTIDQKSKLAVDKVTSAKDVVSLLKESESTSDKIIDVLKKCYI